ncbi:MAG: DMT family transporter [Cyanobacteria bacterium P01_A01_bin.114]
MKPWTNPGPTRLLGMGLVLLSALALALQNVLLRLFFVPYRLWGEASFGGFVTPQLSNILLLLFLRMAAMALLLTGLAPRLYPPTFNALRALPATPRLLGDVMASGLCLFLGLTLLYTALSQVAAGVAIATFFLYPALTLLLAWQFFHQTPRPYQLWLTGVILVGVILTTLAPSSGGASNPILGGISALGASFSFGLYGIVAERALKAQSDSLGLHPVPFSLATFAIVAGLTGLSLLVGQPIMISSAAWSPVLTLTLLSAALTLMAYVLNNFGIRYIGASLTALLSASTPALTTLFAWGLLQEALHPRQLVGVGLVTTGVALLSLKSRQTA